MKFDLFDKVMVTVLGTLFVFIIIAISYITVMLNAEAKCLEAGMPKSAVTWNYKQYCMNLEGTVTVNVQEILGE